MADKEKTITKDVLFEDSLKGVKNDIRLTLIIMFACLILALCARFVFKMSLSNFIFIFLFIWILIYFSHNFFVRNQKNSKDLHNFHFKNNLIDIVFLTVIIHFLGGVEWIGAIFYLCVLAWVSSVLSKKKVFFLCVFSIFCYTELATLEYFGILSHRAVFSASAGSYQDPIYIFIQILTLAIVFLFVVENYSTLAEAFKKNQEKLISVQEDIEESKNVLEIKVSARTRELQELAKKQEETIKERTKEIQEKLEDMERFQKLAIGRELKMIELKKEIKKLKEKF